MCQLRSYEGDNSYHYKKKVMSTLNLHAIYILNPFLADGFNKLKMNNR